jgi:hypothetical protein
MSYPQSVVFMASTATFLLCISSIPPSIIPDFPSCLFFAVEFLFEDLTLPFLLNSALNASQKEAPEAPPTNNCSTLQYLSTNNRSLVSHSHGMCRHDPSCDEWCISTSSATRRTAPHAAHIRNQVLYAQPKRHEWKRCVESVGCYHFDHFPTKWDRSPPNNSISRPWLRMPKGQFEVVQVLLSNERIETRKIVFDLVSLSSALIRCL